MDTDLQLQTLRDLLDSYKDLHSELSEIWRDLDRKAQGVITVCGIFLAGMIAFIRTMLDTASLDDKQLLTASASLLILSIVFALRTLWIREVPAAPFGESLEKRVNGLFDNKDGFTEEAIQFFERDIIKDWKYTTANLHIANDSKAMSLVISQWLLLGAVIAVVLFILNKNLGILKMTSIKKAML